MKVKSILMILFLGAFATFFFVDKTIWMKSRVLKEAVWEYDSGDAGFYTSDRAFRGLLYTNRIVSFEQDTMVFKNKINLIEVSDTLILKWLYCGKLKVIDPKTEKTATYIVFNKI